MDWNNKELVLEAIKNNGWSLRYASDRLKNDNNFLLELLELYNIKLYDLIAENI